MPDRLPPLNALRVFETAARHLNYSRAAEELFLTHSAVSHQIKALEGELAVQLFRRAGRNMLLTEEGQRLYAHVREGLARLTQGVAEVRAKSRQQTLNISVTPSFAAGWLVPRLPDFYHRHPQIEVNLRATTALADFSREDVDLALRYGPGKWPGLHAEKLLHGDFIPVCSPRYRDGRLPQTARELLDCALLHHASLSWEEWFKSVGVNVEAPLRGPRFSDYTLAIRAAEAGQGVVLAHADLIKDELAGNRLIRIVKDRSALQAPFAYYLVYLENTELPPKVSVFRDWLLEQVKENPD